MTRSISLRQATSDEKLHGHVHGSDYDDDYDYDGDDDYDDDDEYEDEDDESAGEGDA